MGEGPAFAQYYNSSYAIIEGVGSTGSSEGYSIKLLKFWDSYSGKKAVEVEVSKGGYNQEAVCFLDELSFFDNGKFVLHTIEIMTKVKEAWFNVYIPSNDLKITPQRLITNAGFSDTFKFSTQFNKQYSVKAKFGEHADIVNNWLSTHNFDGGDFDLKATVPLSAARNRHKFWIQTGGLRYIQYLEIDVNEPHNIKAIDLHPQNNSSYNVGEIIDINGIFKNLGGYHEFGTMIRLTIDGPEDFQYTTYQTIDISKGEQKETVFNWNTTGSIPGQYSITIEAIVENDPYDDNSLTRNITLENPPANISVSLSSMNFNAINIGDCTADSYNIEGYFLESDIEVSAPEGFQISLNEASGYTDNLVISPEENVVSQLIFVRFCPMEIRNYSGKIIHSSSGANPVNVSLDGSGTKDTEISVSITSLASFGSIDTGNCSSTNSYSLSGSNLNGNILISAPEGFHISTKSSSGFSSSLILSPTNGNLSTTTIYVRFCPTEEKNYSGNITHSSTGAESKNVSVSGSGIHNECILEISPNPMHAGSIPDTVSYSVVSNSTWNIYNQNDEKIFGPVTGNHEGGVRFSENTSVNERRYTYTIVADCGKEISWELIQEGAVPDEASASLGSSTGYPGQSVSIPVNVTDFSDVTGFQFTIEYDATKLEYVNCSNWGGGTREAGVQITPLDGKVTFVYNDAPVNIADGKFFDINFSIKENATDLATVSWSDSPTLREISNSQGTKLSCSYENGSIAILEGYILSGEIVYATSNTPLENVSVVLSNLQNQQVSETETNVSGIYSFDGLQNGTYYLSPSINLPWGGATAMDITLYKKHIGGATTLTPLQVKSGDVNGSNSLTSLDLTIIKQRIGAARESFATGDWAFHPLTATINGQNLEHNIQALCYGDANGSYPFTQTKSLVNILAPGNSDAAFLGNGKVLVPVIVSQSMSNLSSVTLEINYPSEYFSLHTLEMAENNEDLYYHEKEGVIRVVYSTLNPLNLDPGDELIRLVFDLNDEACMAYQPDLQMTGFGEFGDYDDQVIEDVSLLYANLNTQTLVENLNRQEIKVYPNPAGDFVKIVNAKESILEIYDMHSRLVLQNTIQSDNTELDISALISGTYTIKFSKNNQQIFRKLVVIKNR